jgi:hypothetical protein
VIQRLQSNIQLLALAETPVADMFLEHPTLNQFIRECVIDCLDNQNVNVRFECKKLLEDDLARKLFFSQIATKLYILLSQSEK